ncbi:MAG: hypothetical protein EBS79_04485 [Gammaproteobacteria bacterium]|nr:hypothetical protein [Gammaproteobacteria bacterium]NBY22424.1 hypothetical protein [Gammaproteobacteria bacterium]
MLISFETEIFPYPSRIFELDHFQYPPRLWIPSKDLVSSGRNWAREIRRCPRNINAKQYLYENLSSENPGGASSSEQAWDLQRLRIRIAP